MRFYTNCNLSEACYILFRWRYKQMF